MGLQLLVIRGGFCSLRAINHMLPQWLLKLLRDFWLYGYLVIQLIGCSVKGLYKYSVLLCVVLKNRYSFYKDKILMNTIWSRPDGIFLIYSF